MYTKSLAESYGQRLIPFEITEDMVPDSLPHSDKWTIEIYFRLLLPFLLPEEMERILYLDTDIIIAQSLSELYSLDFGDKLLFAVPDNSDGSLSERQNEIFSDIIASNPDFHYVNSGVLLMNLACLRQAYTAEKFLSTAERLRDLITAFDQDLINYMFHGHIGYLSAERYNLFARLYHNSGYDYERVKSAGKAIIHYTGPKPWSGKSLRTDIDRFWWEYAKMTPYYNDFLEGLVLETIDTGYENTNEFKYQRYLVQQAQDEADRLRAREKEYQELLEQSRALIERLSGGK